LDSDREVFLNNCQKQQGFDQGHLRWKVMWRMTSWLGLSKVAAVNDPPYYLVITQ